MVLLLILLASSLLADDYLDLNFFIEPQFAEDEIYLKNFAIYNIRNDSIPQTNIFAGKLMNTHTSDSLVVEFINLCKSKIIAPTDYCFYDTNLEKPLLISNIESDSVAIIKHKIVSVDSFKVGIFSLYTPDFMVKNKIAANAKFDFNFLEIAKQQFDYLREESDFVILLSNFSKYIDSDIVAEIPVDVVVSFDYKGKKNGKLANGKTMFYSILSKSEYYGKLRLTYQNGKIAQKWQKVKL
jgi:hypothetical protein